MYLICDLLLMWLTRPKSKWKNTVYVLSVFFFSTKQKCTNFDYHPVSLERNKKSRTPFRKFIDDTDDFCVPIIPRFLWFHICYQSIKFCSFMVSQTLIPELTQTCLNVNQLLMSLNNANIIIVKTKSLCLLPN